MKSKLTAAFVCLILLVGISPGQEAEVEDPAHGELRSMFRELVAAIVEGDVDAQIKHVHPDVVVTWHNHEVCRGIDGLREFMSKTGSDAFKGYKVEPEADALTVLYGGDTGISTGHSVGLFRLLGKDFEFDNRWTATLVKEDGRWLVAAYQVSLNALDNPILNGAKGLLYWAAGISGGLGLLVGWMLGKWKRG